MFSKIYSAALEGIHASLVQVEADISDGLPMFDMVGLLSSEVKEARERVRVAMRNSEYVFPPKRITVNLSPADIRKEGTAFDLPIAIAVLSAGGFIMSKILDKTLIIGELSLNGRINPVSGVLPVAYTARNEGYEYCMVPFENRKEAASIKGVKVVAVECLTDAVLALDNPEPYLYFPTEEEHEYIPEENDCDLSSLIGQNTVRRAIEVATAGHHNLLMVGAPGAGKTMVAKCIPGIMPELTLEESLELSMIYSVSGKLKEDSSLMKVRPFRAPHHTASQISLIGGGSVPRPGEISLASKGVLFLDELPEFSRSTIEVLRQPLESKEITINRINGTSTFPADFMLVAAMNPCKCGYYPDRRKCSCTVPQVNNYRSKISQPLLDRIDIYVNINSVNAKDWFGGEKGESSAIVRERVSKARAIQAERFKNSKYKTNSGMNSTQVEEVCRLGEEESRLMRNAFERYELSGRGYHRILKVARTIADLDGAEDISVKHLTEAISYRGMEVRAV